MTENAEHPPTLMEIRLLADAREWPTIVRRCHAVPDEALAREPELALLAADARRRVGAMARALPLARLVEDAARRGADRRLLLRALNVLGMVCFELGDSEQAEQHYSELLNLATEWDDEEHAARASNNLGILTNVRGRPELALTYYERALAAYQRLGQLRGIAQTHHNLGISYRDLGFPREADAHFRRAAELGWTAGSEDVVALAEVERAQLLIHQADGDLGERLAKRAMQRFTLMSDPQGCAEALRALAAACRARGSEAMAEAYLNEALQLARAYPSALLQAETLRDLALVRHHRGDLLGARAALEEAVALFEAIGAMHEVRAARVLLGAPGHPAAEAPGHPTAEAPDGVS